MFVCLFVNDLPNFYECMYLMKNLLYIFSLQFFLKLFFYTFAMNIYLGKTEPGLAKGIGCVVTSAHDGIFFPAWELRHVLCVPSSLHAFCPMGTKLWKKG